MSGTIHAAGTGATTRVEGQITVDDSNGALEDSSLNSPFTCDFQITAVFRFNVSL